MRFNSTQHSRRRQTSAVFKLMVLAGLVLTSTICLPQTSKAQRGESLATDESSLILKVYYLENTDVEDAIKIITSVFPRSGGSSYMSVGKDSSTNSLIISSTEERHEQIAALLKTIDTEKPETDPLALRVYPLRFMDVNDAYSVIASVALEGKSEVRASKDDRTNSLIIYGRKADHESVTELLQTIDIESRPVETESSIESHNVEIEFYWLIAQNEEDAERVWLVGVPDSISELVQKKIRPRVSSGKIEVVSSSLMSAVVKPAVNGQSSARGTTSRNQSVTRFQLNNVESAMKGLQHSIQGTVASSGSERYAISLMLELGYESDGEEQASTEISTDLLTKPDHPVCLAFAQAGPYPSYLVVVVRKAE